MPGLWQGCSRKLPVVVLSALDVKVICTVGFCDVAGFGQPFSKKQSGAVPSRRMSCRGRNSSLLSSVWGP